MKLKGRFPSRAGAWLALALCLLIAQPMVSAQSATSAPELTATLAWEGTVRIPGWTEVEINLHAPDGSWRGELRLEDRAQQVVYRLPLELPARGRQRIRVPLYITEYGLFSVSLATPTEMLTTQRLSFRPLGANTRHCVVLDPLGRLTPGPENGCDERLLLTALDQLPETPMAWDTLDVLILHEIATTALTPEQQQALLAWVNVGGQLVITSGAGQAQTLAGLPQPLRQAAAGLSSGAQRAFGAGFIAMANQETADAATTTAWLGDWRNHRVPAVSLLRTALPFGHVAPTANALMQVPQSQIPRLSIWLLLLPLYAALVGPGAWMLARRINRPRWVWALTPAGIVLATLGMWAGLGGALAGHFPVTHEIAVIMGSNTQAPARVLQATAIFAPRARALHWETASATRPFAGYVNTAAPYAYYDIRFPFPAEVVWGVSSSQISAEAPPGPITWATEGLTSLPAIQVETAIQTQQGNPRLGGSLRSAVTLHEVGLIFENGQHRLQLADTVEANTPFEIAVPLQRLQQFDALSLPFCSILQTGYFYPQRAASLGAASLGAAYPDAPASCYLTATTSGVPAPTRTSGNSHSGESCLIISIPCPVLEDGGMPLLPQLDFESAVFNWLDENGTLYLQSREPTTLRYLPLQQGSAANTARRLVLRFEDMPEPLSSVSLELWNWSENRWQPLSFPENGAPLILESDTARAVFDPLEGFRVRFTPTRSDFTTVKLTVILETR